MAFLQYFELNMNTSRSRPYNRVKRFRDEEEVGSNSSIEFSVSFPSQTQRSHSPALKSKCCDCGIAEVRVQVQRLKAENGLLLSQNQILKEELYKFKQQNLQLVETNKAGVKKFQTKSIDYEESRLRIKELLARVDKLETRDLNSSIGSLKNQEDTLTTISCIDKDRNNPELQDNNGVFERKLKDELSKYVDVKMKLELTLRKLEQKELFIGFLQGKGCEEELQQ